jgi:bifunctional ADP-heptose synthase (sugar kinase/adenylyltransferase)
MKYSKQFYKHNLSRQVLAEKIKLFKGLKVAVIGDMVADNYVFGHTFRISREAPVLILKHRNTKVIPGGAANSAANLASLGADVTPIGLLGNDEMGRLLSSGLNNYGISRLLSIPLFLKHGSWQVHQIRQASRLCV